jgi:hypothetical protein
MKFKKYKEGTAKIGSAEEYKNVAKSLTKEEREQFRKLDSAGGAFEFKGLKYAGKKNIDTAENLFTKSGGGRSYQNAFRNTFENIPKQSEQPAKTSNKEERKPNNLKRDWYVKGRNTQEPTKSDSYSEAIESTNKATEEIERQFRENPKDPKAALAYGAMLNAQQQPGSIFSQINLKDFFGIGGSSAVGSALQKSNNKKAKALGTILKVAPTSIVSAKNLYQDYKDDGNIDVSKNLVALGANLSAAQLGASSGRIIKGTGSKIKANLSSQYKAGEYYNPEIKKSLLSSVSDEFNQSLIGRFSKKINKTKQDITYRTSDQSLKEPTLTPLSPKEKKLFGRQIQRREEYKKALELRKKREAEAQDLKNKTSEEKEKFKNREKQPTSNKPERRVFSDATPTPRKTPLLIGDGGMENLLKRQRARNNRSANKTKFQLQAENAQRVFNKINNISEDPYSYKSSENRGLLLPEFTGPKWRQKLMQQNKTK